MYAVIETGGKQYRVQPGDIIQVEKLAGDAGTEIKFDKVLFVNQIGEAPTLGKPYIEKALVTSEVIAQGRNKKIYVFKRKKRKEYRKMKGHRQEQTQLLIKSVDSGSGKSEALNDSQIQEKKKSFFTLLKPKGPSQTTKTLGSRQRLREAAGKLKPKKEAQASAESKTAVKAAPKTAAKKKTKKKAAKKD